MGFLDQLRLQNIFGSGSNVFQPPLNSAGGSIRNNQLNIPKQGITFAPPTNQPMIPQGGQINAIAQGLINPPPMNVVLGEQSNPGGEILRQSAARHSPEMELNKEKLNNAKLIDEQKLGLEQQGLNIDKQRADILGQAEKFKQEHPEWVVKEIEGGNIVFFNPLDPSAKPIDTGMKSGTLSDQEKIRIGHTNRMEEINAQGQNQLDAITKRDEVKTVAPNLQNIQNKATETLSALDEIFDFDKDGNAKLKKDIKGAVGKSRMLTVPGGFHLPGTSATTADAKIKRAKDLITLDMIQQMKDASKTGATGFGALNLKELGVLESGASKLDPSLEEGALEEEGKRLREKLMKVLQPSNGFDTTTSKSPIKPTASDLIKKYGGTK